MGHIMNKSPENFERIARAIGFITANFQKQPSLKEMAASVDLSEFHFHRMFTRWAGISPKKFMQFLTVQYAKKALRESKALLDVAYDSGLSSGSRLYDLFVTVEAMTPGEYKLCGRDITISYGFADSPFGECLVSSTARGVCGLSFVGEGGREFEVETMHEGWPESRFIRDEAGANKIAATIFGQAEGKPASQIQCLVKGSRFQIKVWEALIRIPYGMLATYQDIARGCGDPDAVRAAAGAIGANPIAYIIPCHRVILKSGGFSNYRWGASRKQAMIAWEAAHRNILPDRELISAKQLRETEHVKV